MTTLRQDIEFLRLKKASPGEPLLTVRNCALLCLILLAGLATAKMLTGQQLSKLRSELQHAQAEQAQVNTALSDLQAKVSAANTHETETQQQSGAAQARLKEELARYHQMLSGFGTSLEALASAHIEGLWIDAIHLENADNLRVSLAGGASKGALLPDYLSRLSHQESLNSRALYQLSTRQDEGKPLRFEISTFRREEKPR